MNKKQLRTIIKEIHELQKEDCLKLQKKKKDIEDEKNYRIFDSLMENKREQTLIRIVSDLLYYFDSEEDYIDYNSNDDLSLLYHHEKNIYNQLADIVNDMYEKIKLL